MLQGFVRVLWSSFRSKNFLSSSAGIIGIAEEWTLAEAIEDQVE